MKKVFRALTESCVEKQFIGDSDAIPDGWHKTQTEAIEVFAAKEAPPAKRGRPRSSKWQ